jgi:hypothetical protein
MWGTFSSMFVLFCLSFQAVSLVLPIFKNQKVNSADKFSTVAIYSLLAFAILYSIYSSSISIQEHILNFTRHPLLIKILNVLLFNLSFGISTSWGNKKVPPEYHNQTEKAIDNFVRSIYTARYALPVYIVLSYLAVFLLQ